MTAPRGGGAAPRRRPTRRSTARATTAIGIGSMAAALFVLTPSLPEYIDLVDLALPGALVFLVVGAVAVAAGIRRSALLSTVALAGFLLGAVVQLVQLGTDAALLGGDASSLSLFIAGGLGVAVLLWADRSATSALDTQNG